MKIKELIEIEKTYWSKIGKLKYVNRIEGFFKLSPLTEKEANTIVASNIENMVLKNVSIVYDCFFVRD